MSSYSTENIKHHRNIVLLMTVTPLVVIGLVACVLYNTGRSDGGALAVCTKTITSGSVATAANTLSNGQTLCLQGTGNFTAGTINRGVTVMTAPGQTAKAKVIGYLGLAGSSITMENLYINGNGDIRSPFVTGDNVTLRNNEILNVGATRGICILVGPSDGSIKPKNTLIEGNRIHNCGTGVLDQGIYLAHSIGAHVINNYIYDGPDFGLQFYPSAQNSIVEYNVFDGNAQGVVFSSEADRPIHSSNNILRNNIITNSYRRYNIEYYWGGGVTGTGNQATGNCVFNGKTGNIQGPVGFTTSGTITADPQYVDRAAKDFRLKPGSPCAGKGPQISAASPAPQPAPPPSPVPTPSPSPSPVTPPPPNETPPVSVPGADTSEDVPIPPDLTVNQDGTIIADFTGDGSNEVVKDTNNDGKIDPKTETVTNSDGTPGIAAEESAKQSSSLELTNNNTIVIKSGSLPEVRIAKPVAYTFLIAQGVALTGIGTYLAITKLAIFAGIRGRWGL